MIGFPENFKNNNDAEKLANLIQDVLDLAYSEEEVLDPIENLSTLIDIVYNELFINLNDKISLTIEKNSNNSLSIEVNNIEKL
jgi:hypothetical protein|tara:strand:- start:29 stop:277 length:249 start_codon:yes stop_codon:yes gene_type:complete